MIRKYLYLLGIIVLIESSGALVAHVGGWDGDYVAGIFWVIFASVIYFEYLDLKDKLADRYKHTWKCEAPGCHFSASSDSLKTVEAIQEGHKEVHW